MPADGAALRGVQAQIKKANRIFVQMYHMWKNRNRLTMTKIRMFNSNVKSVLLNGCETWKLTTQIAGKLKSLLTDGCKE